MMDASPGSWAVLAIAVITALLAAAVVHQGFKALSGAAGRQRLRPRPAGATAEAWLLGPSHAAAAAGGASDDARLRGLQIRCGRSAAAVSAWSADEPPPLSVDGPSHLWGLLPRAWPFSDIVIRPAPIQIDAPIELVWDAFLAFDRYSDWNPFHRKVEIVEEGSSSDVTVAVRMAVDMGPLLGTLVSTETICYVDSERHIMMCLLWGTLMGNITPQFGLMLGLKPCVCACACACIGWSRYSARHPSALRMVWLLPSDDGKGW